MACCLAELRNVHDREQNEGLEHIHNVRTQVHQCHVFFQMTRQHMYRMVVVSKLTQLNVLDSKEITTVRPSPTPFCFAFCGCTGCIPFPTYSLYMQEERLEAEQYLAGKEGVAASSDLSTVLESTSNGHAGAHNGQGKVPLKVTSLDFDAMCTQIHPSSPQSNGSKGPHASTTVAQAGQTGPPKPWDPGDVKHSSNHLIQSYFRSRMRGEQKVIVLPLDVLMVRNSHVRDRTLPMYDTCTEQPP